MISLKPIQWSQPVHFSGNRQVTPAVLSNQISFSGQKPLHIAILSYDTPENSRELKMLQNAAVDRGHKLDFINPSQCSLVFDEDGVNLYVKGKSLKQLDAVIPDSSSCTKNQNDYYYFMATLKQFKAMGIHTLNGADAIRHAHDKIDTHRILAENGIPSLRTVVTPSPDAEKLDCLSNDQSEQIVVKDSLGAYGVGIFLAQSKAKAIELLNTFKSLGGRALAQEYAGESKGISRRFNVIGGKVVNVFECKAPEGSFKSNISGGGTFKPIKRYSEQEAQMAVQTAKVLELGMAGVDIIQSRNGPAVLEVNSAPSVEWYDYETGEDLGCPIIDALYTAIEHQASSHKLEKVA
jgi:ribosomal protein S6--L-glutamate ligase